MGLSHLIGFLIGGWVKVCACVLFGEKNASMGAALGTLLPNPFYNHALYLLCFILGFEKTWDIFQLWYRSILFIFL